jgi:hypothetical protein
MPAAVAAARRPAVTGVQWEYGVRGGKGSQSLRDSSVGAWSAPDDG